MNSRGRMRIEPARTILVFSEFFPDSGKVDERETILSESGRQLAKLAYKRWQQHNRISKFVTLRIVREFFEVYVRIRHAALRQNRLGLITVINQRIEGVSNEIQQMQSSRRQSHV